MTDEEMHCLLDGGVFGVGGYLSFEKHFSMIFALNSSHLHGLKRSPIWVNS